MFIPGKVPGRTVFLDELAPDALDEVEAETLERLAELKEDVAAVEVQLEQVRIARAELQQRSSASA